MLDELDTPKYYDIIIIKRGELMKIYHTLMPHDVIHDREMRVNTVVLCLDNGNVLTCAKFNHSRSQKLEIIAWLHKKRQWIKTYLKNNATELMWNYYHKHVKKRKRSHLNYAKLMQHGCSSRNRNEYSKFKIKGTRKRTPIPKSVVWFAKHPYYGGSFSPK